MTAQDRTQDDLSVGKALRGKRNEFPAVEGGAYLTSLSFSDNASIIDSALSSSCSKLRVRSETELLDFLDRSGGREA